MSTNEKNYLNGVKAYLSQQTQVVTRLLKSSELTRTEKALIQVRLYYNEKNWNAAKIILEKLEPETKFLRAEKHFLLANFFGFHANWEEAIIHNNEALKLYSELQHQRGQFLTNYNLSVDYSALGLQKMSFIFLDEAQKFQLTTSQKLQVLRAKAWASVCLKNSKAAVHFIEQGSSLLESVEPSERSMFLAVGADVFYRTGDKNRCYEIMKELMYSKVLMDKGRIYLEFALLQKLLFEQPPFKRLKLSSQDIDLSNEYKIKFSICSSLVDNDTKAAEIHWSYLCEIYPLLYTPNFKSNSVIENESIFMTFVNKFNSKETVQLKNAHVQFQNKQGLLIKILTESQNGLRKEEIVEKIWNQKYEVTMDSKLYKLIQRVRENSNHKIYSQNQSYFLKKPS